MTAPSAATAATGPRPRLPSTVRKPGAVQSCWPLSPATASPACRRSTTRRRHNKAMAGGAAHLRPDKELGLDAGMPGGNAMPDQHPLYQGQQRFMGNQH